MQVQLLSARGAQRHAFPCKRSGTRDCRTGSRSVAVRFKPEERDRKGDPIIVYTSNDPVNGGICPYSQAVLIALLEKQLNFEVKKVDLSRKSDEFVDLYHSIIPDMGEKERVPLLVDGPALLVESGTIAEYVERQYSGQGTPLLPDAPQAQAKIKLFIKYFFDNIVPPFERLIHTEGEAAIEAAKEDLLDRLEGLDTMLHLHGLGSFAMGPHFSWSMHADKSNDGPFLLGPYYTLAEVMATPWVARMVQVLPEWRNLDVLDACRARHLHRVPLWMEGCLARPSAVMTDPTSDQLINGLCDWEWSHATT